VIDRKKIEGIAKEALKETKVFLVDIVVSRSNLIQVFIDHPDGLSLDDCAGLHRSMEEKLDREQEDFELQVSSPGLGQPIRVFPQYLKALGEKMEIVLEDGEIIRGILLEAGMAEQDQDAALVVRQSGTKRKPAPEEPVVVPVNRIKTARIEIDFKQL
jgi:ribosome maturation factor RimP